MNNKCVYLHKDLNGVVFYVGQGSLTRAYDKSKSRSKSWKERAKQGFSVEIVQQGLTSDEAIEKEEYLIRSYNGLVNVGSTKRKNISFEELNEWFYIDCKSPSGISWKKNNNANSPVNRKFSGDHAGSILRRKCGKPASWVLSLFNTKMQAHRVVWILHGNKLESGMVIDHINGNPLDNRIENLRQVTDADNSRNQAKRVDNTSGVTGVSVNIMSGIAYYVATWYECGKQFTKSFRVDRLGDSVAKEQATLYRNTMLEKLRNKGINYSESHGTDRGINE